MFPEVDLGEIAETRIGKRRKQRVLEINLTEHRVAVGCGFRGGQMVHARQPADCWGGGGGFQNEQGRAAVGQKLLRHVELILVQNVIGNQETSARDVGLGQQRSGRAGADLNGLPPRLLKSPFQVVEELRRVFVRIVAKEQNVD